MAFSGAGTFVRLYTWVTDRINGVPITDTRMDAEMDGFATGLSTCITKDGQTTATARIPFAAGASFFDGTVGTPAFNFTSDTDSGVYRIGANNIGVAVNGAKVLDVSTAGLGVTGTFALNGEVIMRHVINTNPATGGSGPSNIALGYGASANIAPISTTLYVTAIGFNAAAALTTADHVTAVGAFALASITAGVTSNTAIGIDTLRALTSGDGNTAVGEHAIASATTSNNGTAVGAQSQIFSGGGTNNSSFGANSLQSNASFPLSGNENTGIGSGSLQNIRTTSAGNTGVGFQSLTSMTVANFNTAIGYQAGSGNLTGSYNVFIGAAGITNPTTGQDNILIGTTNHIADTPASGTSNYLNIGGIIKGDLSGATGVILNKVTITPVATAATLTIPDNVTLTGPAASGTVMTLGNAETVTGAKTFGGAGAVGKLKVAGTTSGSTILDATAVASGTLTLPAATDTLVGKATTDVLTNKTLDSAGTGNVLKVSGVTVSAGQYPGETTTGSATAGNVGEYVPGTGSAVALTTVTAVNVTSISLTAGDWDVSGTMKLNAAASTTIAQVVASISTTSATLNLTAGNANEAAWPSAITPGSGFNLTFPTPTVRISVSGTTTVYLVAYVNFATSTLTADGLLRARRAR